MSEPVDSVRTLNGRRVGAAVAIAFALGAAVSAIVTNRGDHDEPRQQVSRTAEPAVSPQAPATEAVRKLAEAVTGGAAPPAGSGQARILPVPGMDLHLLAGQLIATEAVPVQAVVGDRGAWIGTSETDRVFARLDGPGMQPGGFADGGRVAVSGEFRPLPDGFEGGFSIGADDAEALRAQGMYLHVTAVRPS